MRGALRANEEPVGAPHRGRPRIFERLRAGALSDAEQCLHERGRAAAYPLDLGEIGQDALVGDGIDVREVLPATGPHQKEEVQHLGAELLRQVDHRGNLAHVPVGHRHVEREIQAGVGQYAGGAHRGLPGARQVAERVVPGAVRGVEADGGAEDAVRSHQLRFALAQEHAVRAEHGREPLLRSVGRDVPDVLTEKWLPAGEDQEDVRVDEGDLVHHAPALVGRQLASRIRARERRHVTV